MLSTIAIGRVDARVRALVNGDFDGDGGIVWSWRAGNASVEHSPGKNPTDMRDPSVEHYCHAPSGART
ncbi:MAG: hypothetical protein ABI650_06485 [Dokdonella sp.]